MSDDGRSDTAAGDSLPPPPPPPSEPPPPPAQPSTAPPTSTSPPTVASPPGDVPPPPPPNTGSDLHDGGGGGSGSNRRMAIIGAAIIAVLALVAGAVFVFGSDDDEAVGQTAATSTIDATNATVATDDDRAEDSDGDDVGDEADSVASTTPTTAPDATTTTTDDDGGTMAFAGQVSLVSFTETGDGPFTKPVAPEPSGELVAYAGAGGANAGDLPDPSDDDPTDDIVLADADRSGTLPGLYTGRPDEVVCEVDELLLELQADAEIAEIWADIAEIDIAGTDGDGIEEYLASLTAVHAATDIRVTDHALVDGRAEARQAVLQVGTAILIDEFGVPRVRCQSGSPLRPPVPIDGPVEYAGGGWDSFFPERTIAVSPAPEPVDEFVLVDFETGQTFSRPVGSSGAAPVEVAPDEVLAEGRFIEADEFGYVEDLLQIVFPPAGGDVQFSWSYVVTFEGVTVSAEASGPGVYDPVTRTMTGTGTATVTGAGFSNTEDFTWNAVVDPVAGTIVGSAAASEGPAAFELTFEPYETE